MTQPGDWSVTVAGTYTPTTPGWWWVDQLDCLAYLNGSGQLSAVAVGILTVPVILSGSGALTSAAYAITPAAALLSGSGALSTGAYAIVPASAILSSVGTLSVAAFQQYLRAAGLSGSGALAVAAVQQFQRAVNLAGAGTLSAGAVIGYPANLSGGGVLSAAALQRYLDSAALAGSGSLTCLAVASGGPLYDAVAASPGSNDVYGSTLILTLTAAAGASVLVPVCVYGTTAISSVQFGSTAMTLLGSPVGHNGSTSSGYTALYALTNCGTGSAVTITVTLASSDYMCAGPVSYKNVTAFGTPVTNSGYGTPISLSVPSAAGHIAYTAFSSDTYALSTFNQTQRFSEGYANAVYLLGGDAAGASSVSFTATDATSPYWSAIGVDIH